MWGIVISSVASVTHLSSDHYEAFAAIMETEMLAMFSREYTLLFSM